MTLKQFAQFTVFFFFIYNCFRSMRICFYGRKAMEPLGYSGLVITISISILVFWLWYTAGAFSEIFK